MEGRIEQRGNQTRLTTLHYALNLAVNFRRFGAFRVSNTSIPWKLVFLEMEENKQVLFFCDMPSKLMMAVFVLLLKVLQESPNFTSQSKPQQYKTIEKKVIFYLVLILMNRIQICGIETLANVITFSYSMQRLNFTGKKL